MINPYEKEELAVLDEKTKKELIQKGRNFMKGYRDDDITADSDYNPSDQQLRLPQPPLCKAPMRCEDAKLPLPLDFSGLELNNDVISLIRDRRSARVYTEEEMTVTQLSFLLWATQGIKSIRGKSYATIRTVPCGGARHEFETYLIIRNVTGLSAGVYHYLPMDHAIEYLGALGNTEQVISDTLCGQKWAEKANVVFYWTMVAYRAEWRYGTHSHRVALLDAGHLCQNLYLGVTALGLGTCGIGAFSHDTCNKVFEIDGDEEYMVYTAPVGTVRPEDKAAEAAFYKFVEDEGL